MRDLVRLGGSAVLLLLIMLLGSLVLWVGVPLGWLWIGSQIEGSSGSLGIAVVVMMLGVLASIVALVPVLAWLNRKHGELREARGARPARSTALEGVLVMSAGVAVVGFGIWFLFFAGSSPIPLNLSY